MEGYKHRVAIERAELGYRLAKLNDFINSPYAQGVLSHDELAAMVTQSEAMLLYLMMLDKRMELWRKAEEASASAEVATEAVAEATV